MSQVDAPSSKRVQAQIDQLGPWFHNLHLPNGTQTAPYHALGDFPAYKWAIVAPHLPEDLSGWHVLDIGCNAGFYTFELAKRGAVVTAIDMDSRYLAQARWAAEQFGFTDQITFREMQVYDLAHEDAQYDLILFMGVFYHLRYPLLGLDIVAQKVTRLLLFQSLMMPGAEVVDPQDGEHLDLFKREQMHERGFPKMAFIEKTLWNDRTNWWIPNHAGVEAMLRSSGMQVIERLKQEMYLCAPDPAKPSPITTWDKDEYRAATGQTHLVHNGKPTLTGDGGI